MDFTYTEEQLYIRENVEKFCREELIDVARHVETDDTPVSDNWCKKFAELGFLGANIPKKYGGLGLGHFEAILILEEFAKISSAIAFPVFESSFGPALAINELAPIEMRERVLPDICSGNLIVAISMSEPEAGSALTDLKASLTKKKSDLFLNGTKRWCSGASHAGAYLIYCRFSGIPGAGGVGAVLVYKDQEGVTFGHRERHMGFRGVPSADIFLDNVKIDPKNIVIGAGGFKKLMEAFDLERCGNTTMSLALAQSSLDYAVNYIQERSQFGKEIVNFQAVQLKIAEMKMKVDASRLLLYRAVSNAKLDFPSIGDSSIAKCYANEIAREVTSSALQLLGGYGYSKSFPLEQKMRDAWGWGIAGGTIDMQKINIASAVVGRRFNQRI